VLSSASHPLPPPAGGHINHSIFWENLAAPKDGGGGEPTGELKKLVDERFGSFSAFKTAMNTAGAGVQGSGWVWLGFNKTTGKVGHPTHSLCSAQHPAFCSACTRFLLAAVTAGVAPWKCACVLTLPV
jgi:superoxide dismutase